METRAHAAAVAGDRESGMIVDGESRIADQTEPAARGGIPELTGATASAGPGVAHLLQETSLRSERTIAASRHDDATV
jgi:hypothetical protein